MTIKINNSKVIKQSAKVLQKTLQLQTTNQVGLVFSVTIRGNLITGGREFL